MLLVKRLLPGFENLGFLDKSAKAEYLTNVN